MNESEYDESEYTVITADVISSREIEDFTGRARERLIALNEEVESEYSFSLLRGDEIQGVLAGGLPTELPATVRLLRYFLYPFEVRIGVGAGLIAREEMTDNPWELTGEAFHRAREALNYLNKNDRQRTYVKSDQKKIDIIVNSLWLLMDVIQARWTEAQWEAIHVYEKEGTYRKASQKLDIALQNVEKRCSAASWKEFRQAEENMGQILDWFHRGTMTASGKDN